MNYGHKGRARALDSTGRERVATEAVECVNEKEREGRREEREGARGVWYEACSVRRAVSCIVANFHMHSSVLLYVN